jgi:DmsE family decaheme c-type cytochrome
MNSFKKTLILMLTMSSLLIIGISGCETLQSAKPILPIQEYDQMLMGRLDANYIGNDNCLSACHYHEKIKLDFQASTMGVQVTRSGMPIVNCESCHGPGSLAVEGITPEKVAQDAREGKQTACNYDTFINIKELPKPAQSLMCLKCHSQYSHFSLHDWSSGVRPTNDVSCPSCHDVHSGSDLITSPKQINNMCLKCHEEVRAEFELPSRHPIRENKIICTQCHDAHGTADKGLMTEDSIKETCTRCHGEKEGPYAFEHADVNDDCMACHGPHGTVNNNLLNVSEPFLCLQCHGIDPTHAASGNLEAKGAFFTRCTDCHSQIHGTDLPSSTGKGMFIY